MTPSCDVCIFGAGPAGAATALRLADLGISSIVLEARRAKKMWGGESFTGAIRDPLSTLGLWEDFCAAGHVAGYEQRSSWGAPRWTKDSIFSQYGNFWHVDRQRFDDDLRRALRVRGIPIFDYRILHQPLRTAGSGGTAQGEGWGLCLDQDRAFNARYLVDATGRSCALARRLGKRPQLYDHLIAFTALVRRNQNSDLHHTMVIESMPRGWWYAAPVPRGHILAFFTDADLAPRELARSMNVCPANSAFLQAQSGEGWLAVGDACAAHDPLCGWGVCRAMSNGIRAAEAIAAHLRIADHAPLQSYFALCKKQFANYLDGLSRHYGYEQRWARAPFWQRRTNFTFSLA
jgi:flavin-dependent dehydrogenase